MSETLSEIAIIQNDLESAGYYEVTEHRGIEKKFRKDINGKKVFVKVWIE